MRTFQPTTSTHLSDVGRHSSRLHSGFTDPGIFAYRPKLGDANTVGKILHTLLLSQLLLVVVLRLVMFV